MLVVETSDPAETEALGAELATRLRGGDVVLVQGELGTGKTTLVRGAARALGVTDPVTSPTFSIGHRYQGAAVTVSHLDLYRLPDLDGEDPGLLADYLDAGRIAFVEWPAGGADELSAARMRVTLTHCGGDRRRIEVVDGAEAEGAPVDGGPVSVDGGVVLSGGGAAVSVDGGVVLSSGGAAVSVEGHVVLSGDGAVLPAEGDTR